MEIPVWADEEYSKDLPVLRAQGEGQQLEYKERFPQNTRDLAKEIAAFTTSNPGMILIGVSDGGDLIGIKDGNKAEVRDELLKRLEGICRGTVKPAITPIAKYAVENGKTVLVVSVPKGKQPIYYGGNVPYVRHLSESRPAEPHEVLELITEYLRNQKIGDAEETDDISSQFYSELANSLIEILVYSDQHKERSLNPWLDQWRANFGYISSDLRDLSVQDIAIKEGLSQSLTEISDALSKAATFRLTMGCGPELDKITSEVRRLALNLKQVKIDSIQLGKESLSNVKESIIVVGRKMKDYAKRSSFIIESGNVSELQSEVSRLGYTLLRLSYYNIDALGEGIKNQLYQIGRNIHLIETMRIQMDGGKSINSILNKISENSDLLDGLVSELDDE